MNDGRSASGRSALELRREFDQSFALAAQPSREVPEGFLAIGLCADPHALRLADIVGVQPLGAITRLPSPLAALCGLVGFRGAILPVYDLRLLLGYAPQLAPRWIVVAAASPVALAFDSLDGHLRPGRDARSRASGVQGSRRHAHEILQGDDGARPIVAVASVLDEIRAAASRADTQPPKE